MKHHYWEPPIALYLFLGGLAGGILFLSAIMDSFVLPNYTEIFAWPVFWAIVCVAIGCVFLIIDLGQPGVFWRVWTTATSIIKWGATFLVIAAVFALLFFLAFIGDAWPIFAPLSDFLKPAASFFLGVAGFFGLCIMMYTGIMLSTLKAHAFWATPALPVLFTVSAISTGCAAITLTLGGWPAELDLFSMIAVEVVEEIIHTVDIILVVAEFIILMTMVLSFLGAGNVTAKKAAKRWVCGSYAPLFWIGMVGVGLVIPFILYVAGSGAAATLVAPILVLIGGCLLRFLVVNTDDRAPIPGEERYYTRCAKPDAEFVKKWTYGENLF
ncbi:MAG: polysulfide reductase NrfD [Eggerthellaceae bacterium]|nr:polysulfide reductase NrfD [Eggerthellaceae bacterium]